MNLSRRRPGSVHITAPSFPTVSRPSVYRRIAYTFIALTVIIVLAVLWLTSVRAEVTVHVKKDKIRLDGVVEVAKTPKDGQIPGRVVQGTYDKVQEFPVLGASGQPVDPTQSSSTVTIITPSPVAPPTPAPSSSVLARGKVIIYNKYSKEQTLVEKTRLLTPDNKLYRIDNRVVIPSGGQVTVGVYADKTGSEFVLTGPQKFTIPGLFIDVQKFIYAESSENFTASSASAPAPKPATLPTPTPAPTTKPKSGKVVVQADLDRAEKSLTDQVLAQGMKALAAEVGNTSNLEVVYVVKVIDRKFMVRPGDTADNFLASIKLEVTAVYYGKEDMQTLVRSRLRERVPSGREFLPFDGGAITYSLDSADIKQEVASIRVSADAAYRLSPASPLLQKSVIAGKSKDEATTILKSIDGVESVTINIKPGWIDTVPSLKDRIDLNVD